MKFTKHFFLGCLFLLLSTVVHAWEWTDYIGSSSLAGRSSSELSFDEVSELRVRDIKRILTRKHGYGSEELGRVLDKKELIQTLSFEEHKLHQKEVEEQQRDLFWKALLAVVVVGVVTLCWPLLRHAWDVVSVNVVVYSDRKRLELQRCWELQSIEALIGLLCMFVLDFLQVWLSASILLSWVITSKYFFPIPSIPIRPAQLMGGEIAQGPLSGYGINVAPMLIGWVFRFAGSKLEGWVGRAFQRAHRRQKKQQRAQETPEERVARKEFKRAKKRRTAPTERGATATS